MLYFLFNPISQSIGGGSEFTGGPSRHQMKAKKLLSESLCKGPKKIFKNQGVVRPHYANYYPKSSNRKFVHELKNEK